MRINTKDEFKAEITITFSEQQLKDFLCTACEGGINYWVDHAIPVPEKERDLRAEYWHETPLYGQPFKLVVCEELPETMKDKKTVVVDLASIKRGLEIMAVKYPKHFADLFNDYDAITADVFMQCCVFGDAIFG